MDIELFSNTYRSLRSVPQAVTIKQIEGLKFLATKLAGDFDLKKDVDRRQCSYIMATTAHEVGGTWQPIAEKGGRKYCEKYEKGELAKVLGNNNPGDGFLYRGRGYCQITGKSNYHKFSKILDMPDLVTNPDLALDPETAYRIMVHGMKHGTFTGKKLSDYITETKTDYINARRIINGDTQKNGSRIAQYALGFEECFELAF